MQFLTPVAFGLAALLPVIVALYFLKLRREERTVSSVYLWQEMVRDIAANAPWQRLRPSWLLLLQLLFLAALIVALARPFVWTMAAQGDHLIFVIDSSASMAATDVAPTRLGAAAQQARRLAGELGADVPVTLISAGQETRVLLSDSRDRQRLGQALEGLRPGLGGADMTTALELAAAIGTGEPEAQIVVLSDGGVALPDRLDSAAKMRYVPIGTSRENQAISAFSLDPGHTGFVRVTNYGRQPVARRLLIYGYSDGALGNQDGQLLTVRDVALGGGESAGFTLPDLPLEVVALQARLEGEDDLALDDRAWAVAPLVSGAQIQVVGPGNRFLETALTLLPGVEVTQISLEDYEAGWEAEEPPEETARWLTIFDGVLPAEGHYPPGALLFVGPLRATEFFSVTGTLATPVARPASADESLLRYVDLRDLVVQRAARLALPAWAWPVVVAEGVDNDNPPLLVAGELEGRRLAVLAFDLRASDLPLRVGFPLLLNNLVNWLVPGTSGSLPATVPAGQPLTILAPPQVEAILVTGPDGASRELPIEGGTARFEDADAPGVYQVTWAAEGQRWPLGRFAVNASTPLESDIAPREQLPVAGVEGQALAANQPVRREWWTVVAWAALVLLMLEWLVQYRGALVWLGAWFRRHGTRIWERVPR
jgi:Ca-activated chloride channel family protein